MQLIFLRKALLSAAGNINNLAEKQCSDILNSSFARSDGAGIDINQIRPLLLHIIAGAYLDNRCDRKTVRRSASCHKYLQSDAGSQLTWAADNIAGRCGSIDQALL